MPSTKPIVQPPSKGVLCMSSYNPNACASQHYNIVADLAHAPSAISALELLHSCLSQCKAFLYAIGEVDPADTSLLAFDLENFIP